MRTLTLSENWNKKLYGNYFTEIRLSKEDFKVGDIVHIVFVKEKIIEFDTKVICVQKLFFNEIPDSILMLDTGYDRQNSALLFSKFYKDEIKTKKLAVILLNRISEYSVKDR